MNDVVTVYVIEQERQRLSGLLTEANERLRKAARQHAVAKHAYRQASADAILATTSGTVPEKKARADKLADLQMKERDKWEKEELIELEECRNLREQLRVLASEAYAVNSEIRLAGVAG